MLQLLELIQNHYISDHIYALSFEASTWKIEAQLRKLCFEILAARYERRNATIKVLFADLSFRRRRKHNYYSVIISNASRLPNLQSLSSAHSYFQSLEASVGESSPVSTVDDLAILNSRSSRGSALITFQETLTPRSHPRPGCKVHKS